jgi:hypothetical protein
MNPHLSTATVSLGSQTLQLEGPASALEQEVRVLPEISTPQGFIPVKATAKKTTVFFVPSFSPPCGLEQQQKTRQASKISLQGQL